ncbi:GntR family transcriptional regulator [Sediminispirochaeta smaragdinae]|uniref:Transcriptional regulator, GntR family n=1 Tax=Sediminispirochaeta smaragdinae (strain DSM 11293 / JCM 15392 / SEBR 4228) TaxID=573413 RepID=E1R2X7_SEDSS|nr:GntR family transcriptional regulator [Sediminispirochaeta smaragdinae]ADK80409.1 transcriptional regulator, GntR family [Sediminispirochaeta smaragdinae DSM 11293]
MEAMLEKSSGIPLYLQLKQILKDAIFKGEYEDGEPLPSGPRLASLYDVTWQTIRRALSELVQEGLVRKIRGKGSFVSIREITYSIWNFNGFTDYVTSLGKKPTSIVLTNEIEHCGKGEKRLRLIRARGIMDDFGNHYRTIDTSLISLTQFPDIDRYDFGSSSLYRVMREVSVLYSPRMALNMMTTISR